MIDSPSLHLLIHQKLADGRLPNNGIGRVWGGAGSDGICVACDERIDSDQLVIEGIDEAVKAVIQFHVRCFYYWDRVRTPARAQQPARASIANTRR
jgi:hypothetical protein